MSFLYTDWSYDSSEESSISIFVVSGGYGTLRLRNNITGQKMLIPYTYYGLGASKGEDVGYAKSTFDMDSSGGQVLTMIGCFDDLTFPCKGFIMSAGVVDDLGGVLGGRRSQNWSIYMFGSPVGSLVRCHGAFLAALPGAGMASVVASYGPATLIDAL